jgi:hypothetical protein
MTRDEKKEDLIRRCRIVVLRDGKCTDYPADGIKIYKLRIDDDMEIYHVPAFKDLRLRVMLPNSTMYTEVFSTDSKSVRWTLSSWNDVWIKKLKPLMVLEDLADV